MDLLSLGGGSFWGAVNCILECQEGPAGPSLKVLASQRLCSMVPKFFHLLANKECISPHLALLCRSHLDHKNSFLWDIFTSLSSPM